MTNLAEGERKLLRVWLRFKLYFGPKINKLKEKNSPQPIILKEHTVQ